jgi:hypothetical protein
MRTCQGSCLTSWSRARTARSSRSGGRANLPAASRAWRASTSLPRYNLPQDRRPQQEVRPAGAPAPIGLDAAGGHQAVQVRMQRQRTAPGVQADQHPGPRPEMALLCEQLQERVTGGAEEGGGETAAVPTPQGMQQRRQGEDDVEVCGRQQPARPLLQPRGRFAPPTLRAGAVAARVGPYGDDVSGATHHRMRAQRPGAAAAQGAHRLVDPHRQPVGGGVRWVGGVENVLEGEGHTEILYRTSTVSHVNWLRKQCSTGWR